MEPTLQQVFQDNQYWTFYLFNITAGSLYLLSQLTGLSYQFWNILIWFGLLPALWISFAGRRTSRWLNVLSLILLVLMFVEHSWNKWFDQAVVFLNKTAAIAHTDYRTMSVWLCLYLPVLVTVGLSLLLLPKKQNRIVLILLAVLCGLVVIGFPVSNGIIQNLGVYSDLH